MALIGPVVLAKKLFEKCGRTDDGPWLYYKLTNEPKGSGELKKQYHSNLGLDIKTDFFFSHLTDPGGGIV